MAEAGRTPASVRTHLLLTIVAAVVLAPVGALATSVLGLWATLVWFVASVGVLSGALLLRSRISALRLIPPRVILTALVGCTVFVASSIGIVLGALVLLDDEGSTAADVMNHTGLPPGAQVVKRRDSGTQSASYSTTYLAPSGSVTPDLVKFPEGFHAEADLSRLGPATCDWESAKPCDATRVAIFNGSNADYANGHCSSWITQQSNTVAVNGQQRPVVVISVSCSENMPK